MKHHSFEKFINKEKGSKKKEALRQEKRKWKQERNKKYEVRNTKYEEKNLKSEIPNLNTENNNSVNKPKKLKTENPRTETSSQQPATEMPLNKFIAHAGICARREAAELVKLGRRSFGGVEPDGTVFTLTELLASSFIDDERHAERVRFGAFLAAD